MKKNITSNNDEIDLIASLQIIWNGKWKILLITLITFLIGVGYDYRSSKAYSNSLIIKPSDNFEFTKILSIYNFFKDNSETDNFEASQSFQVQENQINSIFLNKFYKELIDFEEFIEVISDTDNVKNNISNFNIDQQKVELFKYANLLEVINKEDKLVLNFEWHNSGEAINILEDTINLTLLNLEKKTFKDFDLNLEISKKRAIRKDMERLDYLLEQSLIAKELDISENQVDNVKLSQSNVSFNINTSDLAYYLRGYKAIDMEIKLIKKRNYAKYSNLEQELSELKKLNINWINYNIYLVKSKLIKDTRLILIISIMLGLIIGVIYVAIQNAFKTSISLRK